MERHRSATPLVRRSSRDPNRRHRPRRCGLCDQSRRLRSPDVRAWRRSTLLEFRRAAASDAPRVLVERARGCRRRSQTRFLRTRVGRSVRRIADQTNPAGSSGVVGSPRIPITARTTVSTGPAMTAEQNHRRRTVPGMYAPEVSIMWVKIPARNVLLNQLLAELSLHERVRSDLPTKPAGSLRPHSARSPSSKNRSMKGTASEYLPWQEPKR